MVFACEYAGRVCGLGRKECTRKPEQGRRLSSSVVFQLTVSSLSLTQKLAFSARLSGQRDLRIHLSPPLMLGLQTHMATPSFLQGGLEIQTPVLILTKQVLLYTEPASKLCHWTFPVAGQLSITQHSTPCMTCPKCLGFTEQTPVPSPPLGGRGG